MKHFLKIEVDEVSTDILTTEKFQNATYTPICISLRRPIYLVTYTYFRFLSLG